MGTRKRVTQWNRARARILSMSIFFLMAGWLVPGVYADDITINAEVTVRKNAQEVEIEVKVANSGQDPAWKVQPSAKIGEEAFSFEPSNVPPGESRFFSSKKVLETLEQMKVGKYPVRVRYSFDDSTGLRYYASAYGLLQTANVDSDLPLEITLQPLQLQQIGEVHAFLKNTSLDPHLFIVSLFTSKNVEVVSEEQRVFLAGKESREISFRIKNRHGNEGMVTPMFLFAEYDTDAFHETAVKEAPLSILTKGHSKESEVEREGRSEKVLLIAVLLIFFGGLVSVYSLARSKKTEDKVSPE